jgi:hypothetical protein
MFNISDHIVKKQLNLVSTTTSECAEHIKSPVCSGKTTLKALSKFINTNDTNDEAIVKKAANILDCKSESCVVSHPTFRQYLSPTETTLIRRELETNFKARGPRDNNALLSNNNIDEILQQWAIIFTDFFNCPFAMMDFFETQDRLANISLPDVYLGNEKQNLGPLGGIIRRPCKTFACVLNTDISSGSGKHWVVVFVDMRNDDWSIEYFNSAGNPPPKAVDKWMANTEKDLQEFRNSGNVSKGNVFSVAVTDKIHQQSRTECGPYTLFYIRTRLEGEPFKTFFSEKITDNVMLAFREHLFRKS